MSESTTIRDELWDKARIFLDEQVRISTETLEDYKDIPDSCPECGRPLSVIYQREDEQANSRIIYDDLVVLKCEKCFLYHACWIQPAIDYWTGDSTFSTPAKVDIMRIAPPKWEYAGNPRWSEGKQPKFPKKIIKAYKESIKQVANREEKMNTIIQSKLPEMYQAGLTIETINPARNKAIILLRENALTQKQLTSLFAAAIYEASHEELKGVHGLRRVGEKISERQCQKIFGVTRKTIRKWRTFLPRRGHDFYL